MGRVADDTATPQHIAQSTGMIERVARARPSEMKKDGLVVRLPEGRYRFSPVGEDLVRRHRVPSKERAGA